MPKKTRSEVKKGVAGRPQQQKGMKLPFNPQPKLKVLRRPQGALTQHLDFTKNLRHNDAVDCSRIG